MTDERIKEEFYMWETTDANHKIALMMLEKSKEYAE
jgi:hypothetical protein